MVKISRDSHGKTRVAKGDDTGLGGQYAPDPSKINKNLNAFKDLEETLNSTPDWKKYYPTPVFREFDSLDIKIDDEDYDFGMMTETEFLEHIAPEIEEVWVNNGSIVFEISHVPNHVEPEWVMSDFQIEPKFFEQNPTLTTGEQTTLNNLLNNVYNTTPSNIVVRECEGYTQILWSHQYPVFANDDPYDENNDFGTDIMEELAAANSKYFNVTAERVPGENVLHMSGWYTLNEDEKKVLLKTLNS